MMTDVFVFVELKSYEIDHADAYFAFLAAVHSYAFSFFQETAFSQATFLFLGTTMWTIHVLSFSFFHVTHFLVVYVYVSQSLVMNYAYLHQVTTC